MRSTTTALLVAVLVAIPVFFLGPVIWTPSPDLAPTPQQLAFFMVIAAVEALTFGAGVVFLLFGWPLVMRMERDKGWAWLQYIAIGWLLLSWWPHDNMHIHNGMNAWGLVRIDYTFHLTLIIAGCLIAYRFVVQGNGRLRGAERDDFGMQK